MLIKFFLFIFFTVACSQVLKNKETVSSDDKNKSLIINISESNDNGSESINTDSEGMQSFINRMSECCFDSATRIEELMETVSKLEKEKEDSPKNMSEQMENVSNFEEMKENYEKNITELMKKVSELKKIKKKLLQEISECNRSENDLVQYNQEIDERERSLREFRIRLDKEYEEQYRLRSNLNKTKKEMYQHFLQLRDQQHQVSECMNDVTFAEKENISSEKYHLAEEKGKSLLYKCRSISDTGRNYIYKCLPSLNASFIPEASIETE